MAKNLTRFILIALVLGIVAGWRSIMRSTTARPLRPRG